MIYFIQFNISFKIISSSFSEKKFRVYLHNTVVQFNFAGNLFIITLYNTIHGVQSNFRVSYPFHVIMRVKCIDV